MTSQPTTVGLPGDAGRISMLRMAEAWQASGQTHQAADAYTRLLSRYQGSAEARVAAERLLALALEYERQRRYHLALGLYEKLERFS